MDRVMPMFSGSGAFALYFLAALALLAIFVTLYNLVTPYREMQLIRDGNKAAALALGGAILGFVIPLSRAVEQSESFADMLVWAGIAFVAQVVAYRVASLLVPRFRTSIVEDHVASGILLAFLSIAIGMLNAAAMSY